jgi:hypothetical protein
MKGLGWVTTSGKKEGVVGQKAKKKSRRSGYME